MSSCKIIGALYHWLSYNINFAKLPELVVFSCRIPESWVVSYKSDRNYSCQLEKYPEISDNSILDLNFVM